MKTLRNRSDVSQGRNPDRHKRKHSWRRGSLVEVTCSCVRVCFGEMSLKGRFLKPGDDSNYAEDRSDVEPTSGTSFIFNPNRNLSLQAQRQRLPVFSLRSHILYLLENYQTVVVVGETGSGKSTQIPQYLQEAGWGQDGMICITEPRRVACTTLAERVAEECDVILGREVGYAIRFDDRTSPGMTQIKYVTEGLLVREMMADPLLRQYSVIMVDEVHERTLFTDILLGLLKKVQRKRKDLRLIVSSATVDADQLFRFFNHNATKDKTKDTAAVVSVEGRNFPVDVFYLQEAAADYVRSSVDTVLKIHTKEGPGGVLVFLTGVEEVDKCVSALREESSRLGEKGGKMQVCPLHGSLHNSDQLQAFLSPPQGVRKVVVATNLAETSITLPGIVFVVDSGFVKLRWFNGQSDALVVVPASQASANQRAGRAGRTRSGQVYRLYKEEDFATLSQATPPEMVRTNLSSAVLNLMALGIDNMLRFDFPSPPPASHLIAALDELFALGAIGEDGQLTRPLGQNMAELPLPPQLAKMLLVSGEHECSEEILSIVAMLQVQNVFIDPRGGQRHIARARQRNFQVKEGDTLTLLNVYKSYLRSGQSSKWCGRYFINFRALRRAVEIRGRMERLLMQCGVEMKSCGGNVESIRRCITAGLFPSAAFLHHSGCYHSVRSSLPLHIHPSSTLYTLPQPQWVIYHEVLHTTQAFMRDLTVIEPSWLLELAPHYYEKTQLADT
uniref:RNA helicase n=1 Tax=Scylla olivacea TaxID=85551 RepID=A0A0P4WGX4_SCYOL